MIVRHRPSLPVGEPAFDPKLNPNVVHIRLTPGLSPDVFFAIAKNSNGIVLEGYGTGGIPYRGRNLLKAVGTVAKEEPVVMTTQALYGGVDLTRYEVGMKALEAGVIPAGDMTREAALTKLMYALGHTKNVDEVRGIMERNMAGELSSAF